MKTVFKKMLSLALVVMLLISAVPFQASAAEYQVNLYPNYPSAEGMAVANVYDDGTIDFNSLTANVDLSQQWVNVADGSPVYATTQYSAEAVLAPQSVYEAYVAEEDEHEHCYASEVTQEATCGAEGVKTFTCECGDSYTETISATGDHSWGAWIETKEATTTEAGELTRTCATCGATETKETAKLTVDSYTLYFKDGSKVATIEDVQNGETVSKVPSASLKSGYDFKGWYSEEGGKGTKMSAGTVWYAGMPQEYYAYYVESVDDDLSTLSVYAKFYVGGVLKNTQKLYAQEFEDGDNMLSWLMNNETKTSNAIFSIVSTDDYEWTPRYYYDYSGNEPLSSQDLIANGNKSVVVKVYSKAATEANVLLYVHTNTTSSSPANIYEMSGYTKGDTVTLSAAKTIVKKHYTGSNMTITGLYTDTTWAQLLNDEKPTAANGIAVEDNGTLRIHVLVKNGTVSNSSSTADSSNPKTGDGIFMAVTVMAVSASALVVLFLMNKKRLAK